VILYKLIICCGIDSAWFQCLKVRCDELLSKFAFKSNLRRYNKGCHLIHKEAMAHKVSLDV